MKFKKSFFKIIFPYSFQITSLFSQSVVEMSLIVVEML
ncbi:MAG: hypothetical protein CM15mP58_22030 [Burkholderiaceae bacterium]|nr:MAG: hypothetical protein CM15mP58_22030 [Burkholderiaceae bacterium]